MNLIENYWRIKKTIPEIVTLVAVSKTKPISDILALYEAGVRIFGENKVQEMQEKYEQLPKDIQWHQIGHLQSNKVKYIAAFVSLIHAVDSLKLLQTINREGIKHNRVIPVLMQIFIATEETKFGLNCVELEAIIQSEEYKQLKNIQVCGLMGMASNTEDENQITTEFKALKICFDKIKQQYFELYSTFKEISMGMSGDYLLAIQEGSTMVRVGSSIFGERNYHQ